MSPDDHAYVPHSDKGGVRAKHQESGVTTVPSVCPHDCTSTCALEVERLSLDQHRPGPRLDAQRLHRRGDLREGRALAPSASTIPTG